jgi:sporulation related protein
MSYEFALDKKAVISLVAGSLAIGLLLFLAGWIVGNQWPMSQSASTSPAASGEQRAELPKEPVLNDEAPARDTVAPKRGQPRVTAPAEPNTTLPPAPQASHASAAAAGVAAVEARAQAARPSAPTNGDVVIISEAEPDTANKEAAAPVDPEYVTVQVGVFLDEKDASRLLKEVESKGYSPTFFSGRDAEARQWYAVRIGVYADREQATKAAANFTKQEKMKAVVRPLESL